MTVVEVVENGVRYIVCPYCGYKWIPRTKYPRECPFCKRYLRWRNKNERK